jgi:hypothetical protein
VTDDSATFPLALDINALLFVRFVDVIVVAAPVIAACLLLNVVQSVDVKAPVVDAFAVAIPMVFELNVRGVSTVAYDWRLP